MVHRAAEAIIDKKEPGTWAAMDNKNLVLEEMLPVLYHGTMALERLGYMKQRQVLPEQLEDLPVGSIVSGMWTAEKWADPEGERWHVAGKAQPWTTEFLIGMSGDSPFTLLREGQWSRQK